MADVYATIEDADRAVVEKLAEVLEFRAADPQQIAMREEYLGRVAFRADARVVEVGCGTGAVARAIAARSGVATVIGVDPSPVFIEKARALAADVANVSFLEGDARSLPFDDVSAPMRPAACKRSAPRSTDAGEFRLHCVCELHRPQAGPRRLIKALMRLAGIEPAASRSGGARSIP
jgi:SAM-dependent methyltransferase